MIRPVAVLQSLPCKGSARTRIGGDDKRREGMIAPELSNMHCDLRRRRRWTDVRRQSVTGGYLRRGHGRSAAGGAQYRCVMEPTRGYALQLRPDIRCE